jgi:ribosome-binding factor A
MTVEQTMTDFKRFVLFTLLAIATTVIPFVAYNQIHYKETSIATIQSKVYRLQRDMNLSNWRIEVEARDLSEVAVDSVDGRWESRIVAQVETIPEYYIAKIYVDPTNLKEVDKHVLMHEMYHIHFSEIRNYFLNDVALTQYQVNKLHFYEERFVESITRGSEK